MSQLSDSDVKRAEALEREAAWKELRAQRRSALLEGFIVGLIAAVVTAALVRWLV